MATEKTCPATVTQTIKSAISKNPINALLIPVKREKTSSKASSRGLLIIEKSDTARFQAAPAPAMALVGMAGLYSRVWIKKIYSKRQVCSSTVRAFSKLSDNSSFMT